MSRSRQVKDRESRRSQTYRESSRSDPFSPTLPAAETAFFTLANRHE
ncbi:MAG: hypothetical protein MI923_18760 [Phycisphaerales bacterium]|nr:hypothetical protein [Phycisphaerales bacterium]